MGWIKLFNLCLPIYNTKSTLRFPEFAIYDVSNLGSRKKLQT